MTAILHHRQGRKHAGEGRADVGSQRHGQHFVHRQNANANQGSESRGRNRTGLYNDGDAQTNQDGQVVVHLSSLWHMWG